MLILEVIPATFVTRLKRKICHAAVNGICDKNKEPVNKLEVIHDPTTTKTKKPRTMGPTG